MARMVHCIKKNKELEGLAFPPVPGERGKRIWAQVSKDAWDDWMRLQTMIINEYGLNCADIKVRKHLLKQCEEYFFGAGATPAVPNHVPVEEKPAQ